MDGWRIFFSFYSDVVHGGPVDEEALTFRVGPRVRAVESGITGASPLRLKRACLPMMISAPPQLALPPTEIKKSSSDAQDSVCCPCALLKSAQTETWNWQD